jgi:DNA replication protein DnaC
VTTKTIDTELSEILARATRGVVENDRARPDPDEQLRLERLQRRAKAMTSKGWEQLAMRRVRSPDYDEGRAVAYLTALRAIDNPDGGIVVLAGNPGSGKTAAAARWAFTRVGNAPRFVRAAEFFRWSRYDHEKRDGLLAEAAVVLDDVGAEYADPNGSYRVDLDELVDRFYADARILVITTNIAYATPEQRDKHKTAGIAVDAAAPTFVERYGERVTDRIRETGRWVDSAAQSMRKRAG